MTKLPSYRDRDYAFGQTMLNLRTAIGFTQAAMADYLGVSRFAIGAWEVGTSYPKVEHLKSFIELAHEHGAFPTGREADAIRALWQASRQKVLLEESWLAQLLSLQPDQPLAAPTIGTRFHWQDALAGYLLWTRTGIGAFDCVDRQRAVSGGNAGGIWRDWKICVSGAPDAPGRGKL